MNTSKVKKKVFNPMITYIFGQGDLLNMLEKRANALKEGDYQTVKKVQDQMTKFKNDNFEELMRP